MSTKTLVFIGMSIGSMVGSYLPMLFGVDILSLWSVIWGGVGGLVGVYIGFKFGSFMNS